MTDNAQLFELTNSHGMTVGISNVGATITSIRAPDRHHHIDDVTLGFKDLESYRKPRGHFGGTVGRVANRMRDGQFMLDGHTHTLARDEKGVHIHGGPGGIGFDKVLWQLEARTGNSVTMRYVSPDGEHGYPGEVTVHVTYTLGEDNALHMAYRATTTAPTPINLTNHTYFNLGGEGHGTIHDHRIRINAAHYLPTDEKGIPGEVTAVDGTPFDLRQMTRIGDGLARMDDPQIAKSHGYDHTFVLDAGVQKTPHLAAHVEDDASGRVLDVLTTEPGVQFYTGNTLNTAYETRSGTSYQPYGGFALETQHFPDSANRPDFPSTILRPGEVYTSETIYQLSLQKQPGVVR